MLTFLGLLPRHVATLHRCLVVLLRCIHEGVGWGGVGGHVNVPCFLICNDFSSLYIKELVPPRETVSHLWLESLKPPCHASLVGSLFGPGGVKRSCTLRIWVFSFDGLSFVVYTACNF